MREDTKGVLAVLIVAAIGLVTGLMVGVTIGREYPWRTEWPSVPCYIYATEAVHGDTPPWNFMFPIYASRNSESEHIIRPVFPVASIKVICH